MYKLRPAEGAIALDALKSDTVDLPSITRAIYVGSISGGTSIKVTCMDDTEITFTGLIAGTILPVRIKRIWSNGTTASALIGLL